MKKTLAILFGILLVIGLFGGCANTTDSEEPVKTFETDADATDAPDSSEQSGDSDPFMISEEGITWEIFKPSHTVIGTQIDNWNESMLFQKMEELTGVHLEFITPVLGQEKTQLQLSISSGQLPDFISGTNNYTGGGEALVNDGITVNLAEHIDKLPNFNKQLNLSDLRRKEVFTDSGQIPGFATFYENDEESEVFVGILIRKDLLDEVEMDVPVTYDDWHTVLTAFKEEAGIAKGFVPGPEMFAQNNMWSIGFDFGYVDYFGTSIPFYQKDGKVRYAPIDDTEAFKAYIEMMQQWYSEGLIDPDFQNVTDVNSQIGEYSNLDTGACVTAYSLGPVLSSIASASKEDFEYVCAPVPVLKEGQTTHMYAETKSMDLCQISITTDCEELDLALKYWDNYYSPEISLLACWGEEGLTFEYDADGNAQWTDEVISNPDYNFLSMRIYYLSNLIPGTFERRATLQADDFSLECNDLYREGGDNSYRISSNVSLTEEENEIYLAYMSDILTYVQEKCIKYIAGGESLDSFDKLIEDIKSMNVSEVIDVYQQALDRYNAR